MLPLKILHIIWSTEMGGISKVVLHLCEEQQKDPNVHPAVFCAKGRSELFENFEKKGIPIIAGQFKGALKIPYSHYLSAKELMMQFDIIHFHSYNPILAYAAKQSGKKIVYTEHGNFGIGRKRKLNDVIIRWMQKHFLNKSIDAISFNSKFTQNESTRRFGLHQTKKEVIYNGIPENLNSISSSSQFRKSENEFLIAAIGRLAHVKRFDRLLDALSQVNELNVRLVIMGTGPEEASLKKQVATLEKKEIVYFSGQGNSLELLQESNLCVIPSQGEAFGLVAIEAYQQGLKVIVFEDGGGVTEIVGRLEPDSVVQNASELATLISRLVKQQTESYQKIARINYASQFSMENMADKIKQLYLSI